MFICWAPDAGLKVEELYRASPTTRPIFAAVGADTAAHYTAQVRLMHAAKCTSLGNPGS